MKTKAIASALCFCAIFALAFYLRQFTFWLPHWQGDQSQYVMLAMKLRTSQGISFTDYNLRGINTEVMRIDNPSGTEIIYPYRVPGGKLGSVLEVYKGVGLGFLDIPFFYRAPLLPILLAVSHELLAPPDQPFAVIKNSLGKNVMNNRPQLYLKTQLWAAIIPFACSLMVLLAVYLWSRREFGEEAALYASFIMATNPIAILTANRVWTEDLSLLFVIMALLIYRWGLRQGRSILCFAAGIAGGLAVLSNPKALLVALIAGLYTSFVLQPPASKEHRGFVSFVSNAASRIWTCGPWWLFLAGMTLISCSWFWTIYQHYGNPFWQPEPFNLMIKGLEIESAGGGANIQGWYNALLAQPPGWIYYTVGTAAVCWPFVAGYATLVDGWRSGRNAAAGLLWDDRPVFLWCWVLGFVVFFLPHRIGEYRYLLFIYPALAVLSGWMCVRVGRILARYTAHGWIAKGMVILFLLASAAYSIRLIQPVLWGQYNLVTAPWR